MGMGGGVEFFDWTMVSWEISSRPLILCNLHCNDKLQKAFTRVISENSACETRKKVRFAVAMLRWTV